MWSKSPATGIEYRGSNPNGLKSVVQFDDIDINVKRTFEDRIRFANPATGKLQDIPMFFYNENDRIKANKISPFFTLTPMEPMQVEDHVISDMNYKYIQADLKTYTNNSPVWYEFPYKITLGCDNWSLFRNLSIFMKDVVFPLVYQQRYIIISNDNGENRREILITGESKTEDMENNYFQYDLTVTFRLGMYVLAWKDEYPIDSATIKLAKTLDENPDRTTDIIIP